MQILSPAAPPQTTVAFDAFWRFAVERQLIYLRRAAGLEGPWTDDSVLSGYKFTNVYRAADRVSQYLLRNVVYDGEDRSTEDIFARILLFKTFNRISTWEWMSKKFGDPTAELVRRDRLDDELTRAIGGRMKLFSAAYIMPTGRGDLKRQRKHSSFLELLRWMLRDEVPKKVADARSLSDVYELLLSYPMMGPFLAFQFAIDLNYSTICDFDENELVVAGPGALDGLSKCFTETGGRGPAELIAWTQHQQEEALQRLGLEFPSLGGRLPKLIDVQNLFCEVSKYTRVSHPDIAGSSGRTRIKQKFKPTGDIPQPFFPPKWGIAGRLQRQLDILAGRAPVEVEAGQLSLAL